MLTIPNHLQNGIMINFCITFKSIQVYSSNYSINIDRTYHINNAFNSGVMKHELIWLIYSCQAELADGKAIVKNLKRLISPTFVGQISVFPRDAILPSVYGFPECSSVLQLVGNLPSTTPSNYICFLNYSDRSTYKLDLVCGCGSLWPCPRPHPPMLTTAPDNNFAKFFFYLKAIIHHF